MDILVKGVKATIGFVRPVPEIPFTREEKIMVWLDLKEPLPGTGTVGFEVYLPPIAYTKAIFLDALCRAADEVATGIIEQSEKHRAYQMKEKEQLTRLIRLVKDIEKMLAE